MKPFVTICVPTYNKAFYLKDSLSSLLDQTFMDFKLIVVDDACSDDTDEVVKSFCDPRITYIRNLSRLGMTSNWNKCVELGLEEKGRYLAIFHDDDIYLPQLLSREVAFLESHPKAGLVHTAACLKEQQTDHCLLKRPYPDDRVISAKELLSDLCKHHKYHITTPSVLARKEAYRKAGRFDPEFNICPDLDLWWRMLECYDLGYIAEPLVTIRISSQQVSSSPVAAKNAITQEETLKHLEKAIKRLKLRHEDLDEKYYLSKAKYYCARQVLRATAKAILTPDKNSVKTGCKRALELSSKPDILAVIVIMKMLNNKLGRNMLALLLQIRRCIITRKVIKGLK